MAVANEVLDRLIAGGLAKDMDLKKRGHPGKDTTWPARAGGPLEGLGRRQETLIQRRQSKAALPWGGGFSLRPVFGLTFPPQARGEAACMAPNSRVV